jgi:hypothetical protein
MNTCFVFDELYTPLMHCIHMTHIISFFLLFWGVWAPPNGSKKVHKSPQVDGMYGPMS